MMVSVLRLKIFIIFLNLQQSMETFTGITQLLRNLCHGSVWSYAILWKLQETTQMLLACEDAYSSSIKSHATMEHGPRTGFYSSDPVVTTFGCQTNARIEDIPAFSIDGVISNISRYCYFLGEGIVGITASSEKHKWIRLWELNSRLLLEYPEEMQLQAAAGIKTILLVPVLPFGVVQLGSFYELSEDFKLVAQIKDLFLSSQYTLEVQPIFSLETDGYIALDSPMKQKYSACLATATEFTDPSNFKPVVMQDWTNLNCDETTGKELLPQLTDQLPQVGLGADSSEDIIWDEMFNELLSDFPIEQRATINSSINTGSALVGDQSILSYRDEEIEMIPVIGNRLAPDDPIMLNNDYGTDLNHIEESYLGFGEEFDVVMNSITDGIFLNYPGEEIQLSSPAEFQESARIANELTNPTSFFQAQVPKPVEEPAAIMKDNRADNLPDDKHFESAPSITRCKDGDLLGSEVSIPGIDRMMPSAFSNTEGCFRSHLMNVQNNSINIPSSNDDQQDTIEQELHKNSRKQGKKRACGGTRPRDRQLIQDRIRELRELIPNGSKCSIDELLERAVAHMVFLQSVPVHADKLNKSRRTKVVYSFPECLLLETLLELFSLLS